MKKGTWTVIMSSAPATSWSGIGGLSMLWRRYGSGYGMQVGRRRLRV
jgi:hypothetical protein